jgi:hypothetical protein
VVATRGREPRSVSKKMLSAKELDALNRISPGGLRYPPGGARTELRVATTRPKPRGQNKPDEGGT